MKTTSKATPMPKSLNRVGYGAFVVAGIYFMIVRDFSQAVVFWGLALVFDPFNPETPFPKRPFYQQAWLIVHTAIAIALFVMDVFKVGIFG